MSGEAPNQAATRLLEEARSLLEQTKRLDAAGIKGAAKLSRAVCAEVKFLQPLVDKGQTKPSHVQGTNLKHIEAVVWAAKQVPEVASVCHKVTVKDDAGVMTSITYDTRLWPVPGWLSLTGYHLRLTISSRDSVDVEADGGRLWLKVTARNVSLLAGSPALCL